MTTPNLMQVGEALDECVDLLDGLTTTSVRSESQAAFKSSQAEVTRELLRLSDKLTAAGSLVREEYWRIKGLSFQRGA